MRLTSCWSVDFGLLLSCEFRTALTSQSLTGIGLSLYLFLSSADWTRLNIPVLWR